MRSLELASDLVTLDEALRLNSEVMTTVEAAAAAEVLPKSHS